jgi:hypothetical protein
MHRVIFVEKHDWLILQYTDGIFCYPSSRLIIGKLLEIINDFIHGWHFIIPLNFKSVTTSFSENRLAFKPYHSYTAEI